LLPKKDTVRRKSTTWITAFFFADKIDDLAKQKYLDLLKGDWVAEKI
jgi:hypothetical protein